MSDLTSTENNLPLSLIPSNPEVTGRTRDTTFYDNYNLVVILVESTFFRVPASLLAPDPDVEDYELKPYMKDVFDLSGSGGTRPGTSDEHPIVLPAHVNAHTFRELLMFLSGGVTNKRLLDLIHATDTSTRHSFMMIKHLSSLGYLAGRFGLKKFDEWAQSKLWRIFLNSTPQLVKLVKDKHWDVPAIAQLVNYMQATDIVHYRAEVLSRIRLVICGLVIHAYNDLDQSKGLAAHAIISTCVGLYKKKTPLVNSPNVFGFIFAVIISLGPHSPLWNSELTREDRRVLYAANSLLVRLCSRTDLCLGWLLDPTDMFGTIKDCDACSELSMFKSLWDRTFGQCNGLNTLSLSEDIRHVVRLPSYRQLFFEGSNTFKWFCSKGCRKKLLVYIDDHIDKLYCAFADKYKHLEETV